MPKILLHNWIFNYQKFCQWITFGAHKCSFSGFAAITAAFIKGQALLPCPSHHLSIVWQQSASGQRANTVNSAGVGVWDEQSPSYWVHCQEVLMGRVITAVTETKVMIIMWPAWFSIFTEEGFKYYCCWNMNKKKTTFCFIIVRILPVSEIFVPSREKMR